MYEYKYGNFNPQSTFTTSTNLIEFLEKNKSSIINQNILGIFSCNGSICSYCNNRFYHFFDTPCIVVLEDFELIIETLNYSKIKIIISPRKDTIEAYESEYPSLTSNFRGQYDLNVQGKNIHSFAIETFSHEYCLDASMGTMAAAGGDYFSKVSFILNDNSVLNFCAEDPIMDGYMDVWVSANI
jgi:hypothetical protein